LKNIGLGSGIRKNKPIPDPGSATQLVDKRAVVQAKPVPGTNVTYKIENYFIFKLAKKIFLANYKQLKNFLPEKFSISSEIYRFGIRDSGKTLFQIPVPQHCL
jgi:hypothetical protein